MGLPAGVLSGVSAFQTAEEESAIAKGQARLAEYESQLAADAAERKGQRAVGEIASTLGSSGIPIVGSALAALLDQTSEYEREKKRLLVEGRNAASLFRSRAASSMRQGRVQLATSILAGASQDLGTGANLYALDT